MLIVVLGQGTNIYNLLMHSEYSEESIRGTLLEQWANGIKVLQRIASHRACYTHVRATCRMRKHLPAARASDHFAWTNSDASIS